MSVVDQLIAAARDVKIAQAQAPRAVQTVEQRQVESRSNVGGNIQTAGTLPNNKSGVGLFGSVPGGKKTVAIIGGLIVAGFLVKKVL